MMENRNGMLPDQSAALPAEGAAADNTPLIPLPNPGEGGSVFPGDDAVNDQTPQIPLPTPEQSGTVYPGADMEGLPPTGTRPPTPSTPSIGTRPPTPSAPSIGTRPPTPSTPSIGGTTVIQPLPDNTVVVPTRYAAVRFLNATHGYPAFRIFVDGTRVVNLLNPASASGYVRVPAGLRRIAVAGQDGYVYIARELPFVSGSTSTVAIINRTGGLELAQIADACRVI